MGKFGFPANSDLKSIFVQSYLLRPTWLSALVLVKPAVIKFVQENDNPGVDIDQDVIKLLRHLPSNKLKNDKLDTVSRLTATCPEYILMVINRLLETLPVNRIAIAILKEKNAMRDVVKFRPVVPKEEDAKKDFKKAIFDSRISIRQKELFSDIALCVDLLNHVRLSDDGDNVSVASKITRWHFM